MQDRWFQTEAVDELFKFYSVPRKLNCEGIPERKNALVCLPTGTGKSVVLGRFFQRALQLHPTTRGLKATHVGTLIEQNAKRLRQIWPEAPLGIYSSQLKRRDTVNPIIFGGIQSMVKKYPVFGYRDFLAIDETHLVGDDGSYLKFICELMYGHTEYDAPVTRKMFEAAVENPNCNPFLKVIGLTATHYRLGMGLLTNGPIFTDIVYNLCTVEGFNRLLAEGYLSPLIPKRTETSLEVSGVGMSAGDFNQTQLQKAVDKEPVTYAALCEMVTEGNRADDYRHCWMIFASGIEHAEHITAMLNGIFGVSAVALHNEKGDAYNEQALKDWKAGKYRCAVSMNKLTTGVDHPPVDFMGIFRPTMSTGLWVQMLGRGTRPYDFMKPGDVNPAAFPYVKQNCKVMDFAKNTRRLGPINDPVIPRRKGEGPPGDAPVRVCEQCNTYCHASAKVCHICGTEFPKNEKLVEKASNEALIKSDLPQIENIRVERMVITPHRTKNGEDVIKVAYYCELMRTYYELVNVQSVSGLWKKRSRDWFRQVYDYARPVHDFAVVNWKDEHTPDDVPARNIDILQLNGQLRAPRTLKVWMNHNPKPEIMGYEF